MRFGKLVTRCTKLCFSSSAISARAIAILLISQKILAGAEGFEPPKAVLETARLPLAYAPTTWLAVGGGREAPKTPVLILTPTSYRPPPTLSPCAAAAS